MFPCFLPTPSIPSSYLIPSSLLLSPWSFVASEISCEWTHGAHSLCLPDPSSSPMLLSSACGMPRCTPLYGSVMICLFIQPSMNNWAVSIFGFIKNKASRNICVRVIWMWIFKILKLTNTNYMYLSYITWCSEICT